MDALDRVRRERSTTRATGSAQLGIPGVEVGRLQSAELSLAPPGDDPTIQQRPIPVGGGRGPLELALRVPALDQLADRAWSGGDQPVVHLGDEPSQLLLGLAPTATNGAGDVLLAPGVEVTAGEHAQLPAVLASLADRPGHGPALPPGWAATRWAARRFPILKIVAIAAPSAGIEPATHGLGMAPRGVRRASLEAVWPVVATISPAAGPSGCAPFRPLDGQLDGQPAGWRGRSHLLQRWTEPRRSSSHSNPGILSPFRLPLRPASGREVSH